jgi:hypothetical protein
MAHTIRKSKGRSSTRRFVQFPNQLLESRRFLTLSGHAVKTLMYLASQYNGHNNGDLGIAWKIASVKGISSNDSLRRGALELIEAGFVIQSRQGGRNRCSLFALAWFSIDHCDGKLDITATNVAPIDWKEINRGNLSEPNTVQCEPNTVQSAPISTGESVH